MNRAQKIILLALEHIQKAQQPDGSFISLAGPSEHEFSTAIPRTTTFFASSTLLCLENATGHIERFLSREAIATLDAIKKKAAQFLLGQKSVYWSFNYWNRYGPEATTIPYPDDLDDTFAALAALAQYDQAMVGGDALAEATKLLVAAEERAGGPYRTWLVKKCVAPEWRDTDMVVNSTIGYFLSLIGVALPGLDKFLDDAIRDGSSSSRYYPGPVHAAYFISRYYKNRANSTLCRSQGNDIGDALVEIIFTHLQHPSKKITPLEYAMAISSLINLGRRDKAVTLHETLVLSAEQHGFMPYAFCIDPAQGGQRSYAGASALTAAFTIEALSLSLNADQEAPSVDERDARREAAFHERIRALARAACTEAGTDLQATAFAEIQRISDKKITSISYDFGSTLAGKGKNIPHPLVEQLSLANLYGWMAYTIYDDAIDNEGNPLLIPCANLFSRKLADTYSSLGKEIHGVRHLFSETMDRIENASLWELTHCRIQGNGTMPLTLPSFGSFENLADRSIGHALGPLTLLLYIGCAPTSNEYQRIAWMFRHYLIARQLHDDAHDWADDLMRGRINSVGALVIHRFQNDRSKEAGGHPDIPRALPILRRIFWEDTINDIAALIRAHIAGATVAREKSNLLFNTDFLQDELDRLQSGAARAVKERNNAILFLKQYRCA